MKNAFGTLIFICLLTLVLNTPWALSHGPSAGHDHPDSSHRRNLGHFRPVSVSVSNVSTAPRDPQARPLLHRVENLEILIMKLRAEIVLLKSRVNRLDRVVAPPGTNFVRQSGGVYSSPGK